MGKRAILICCFAAIVGCTPPPAMTKGTFTESYMLTMQRGTIDVTVQTSGPAKYIISQYAMDHPMGKRPDTEAKFTTPAGSFLVTNRNQSAEGVTVNGTFYPQPEDATGRSQIIIDKQGKVTFNPWQDPKKKDK